MTALFSEVIWTVTQDVHYSIKRVKIVGMKVMKNLFMEYILLFYIFTFNTQHIL